MWCYISIKWLCLADLCVADIWYVCKWLSFIYLLSLFKFFCFSYSSFDCSLCCVSWRRPKCVGLTRNEVVLYRQRYRGGVDTNVSVVFLVWILFFNRFQIKKSYIYKTGWYMENMHLTHICQCNATVSLTQQLLLDNNIISPSVFLKNKHCVSEIQYRFIKTKLFSFHLFI